MQPRFIIRDINDDRVQLNRRPDRFNPRPRRPEQAIRDLIIAANQAVIDASNQATIHATVAAADRSARQGVGYVKDIKYQWNSLRNFISQGQYPDNPQPRQPDACYIDNACKLVMPDRIRPDYNDHSLYPVYHHDRRFHSPIGFTDCFGNLRLLRQDVDEQLPYEDQPYEFYPANYIDINGGLRLSEQIRPNNADSMLYPVYSRRQGGDETVPSCLVDCYGNLRYPCLPNDDEEYDGDYILEPRNYISIDGNFTWDRHMATGPGDQSLYPVYFQRDGRYYMTAGRVIIGTFGQRPTSYIINPDGARLEIDGGIIPFDRLPEPQPQPQEAQRQVIENQQRDHPPVVVADIDHPAPDVPQNGEPNNERALAGPFRG